MERSYKERTQAVAKNNAWIVHSLKCTRETQPDGTHHPRRNQTHGRVGGKRPTPNPSMDNTRKVDGKWSMHGWNTPIWSLTDGEKTRRGEDTHRPTPLPCKGNHEISCTDPIGESIGQRGGKVRSVRGTNLTRNTTWDSCVSWEWNARGMQCMLVGCPNARKGGQYPAHVLRPQWCKSIQANASFRSRGHARDIHKRKNGIETPMDAMKPSRRHQVKPRGSKGDPPAPYIHGDSFIQWLYWGAIMMVTFGTRNVEKIFPSPGGSSLLEGPKERGHPLTGRVDVA